jgi:hypothetical protein
VSDSEDLLVSDAERASAASDLRQHHDAGRLTLEEFEGRLEQVQTARTETDLRKALRQLPAASRPTLSPRDRRWRSLALQYACVSVCAILIWLFSGAQGDFWPRWVLLVTLIMFARRALGMGHRHQRRQLPPDQQQLPPS